MAEEYDTIPAEDEESLAGTSEEESEKLAQEIGKLVERIEKERRKISEEEEEDYEYSIVAYKVEDSLLYAMLFQEKMYEKVLNGEIGVSQAQALIEKELAAVTARLEQDLKRASKTKKKSSKKKTTSKSKKKSKKKS